MHLNMHAFFSPLILGSSAYSCFSFGQGKLNLIRDKIEILSQYFILGLYFRLNLTQTNFNLNNPHRSLRPYRTVKRYANFPPGKQILFMRLRQPKNSSDLLLKQVFTVFVHTKNFNYTFNTCSSALDKLPFIMNQRLYQSFRIRSQTI